MMMMKMIAEDVESLVQAELEISPAAVLTKIVGLPPSQGLGGVQTLRNGILITGSQPLPSPSGSFGTSPLIEKLAFQMSKISDQNPGLAPAATDNKTSFSSSESSSSFKKVNPGSSSQHSGPSLLSQTAPSKPNNVVPPFSSEPLIDYSQLSQTPANQSPLSKLPPKDSDWNIEEPSRPTMANTDRPTIPPPAVPYDPRSLERITVKISDLGQRATSQMIFKLGSTEVPKQSLEAIGVLGLTSGASAIFELLTGDYLFNPDVVWKQYTKDDNHVAQIIELLGSLPPNIAFSGKFGHEIFNRCEELRHMHKLKTWPLEAVLTEKYCLEKEPAVKLTAFLEPMLNWIPRKQATAQKMLKHSCDGGSMTTGASKQNAKGQSSGTTSTAAKSTPLGKAPASVALSSLAVDSISNNNQSKSSSGNQSKIVQSSNMTSNSSTMPLQPRLLLGSFIYLFDVQAFFKALLLCESTFSKPCT
ncbi:hypothetical protein PPACK8108_LOCUS24981 [Phakopsora pachyrhizi]|uniref:non-specific serine/threonine protein kinase n=1 Tax=Phakopsora pachyrhizi TaxID=170000 RepID=A0AAV0BR31_PHAPC|nr:hypothetical protein PPACK8108_LOCUS24981 [Phakopsora pachyrhizi]